MWGLEYASGKEGQQAVNASDFAIAQSRFLLDLTLVHGRWNDFMRLSTITVVLFSFYKNAVVAGVLCVLAENIVQCWSPPIRRMVNWHSQFCDRRDAYRCIGCLWPSVTCPNELNTKQTLLRWIALVFVHTILEMFHDTITSCSPVSCSGATRPYLTQVRHCRVDHDSWHLVFLCSISSCFVGFVLPSMPEYSTIIRTRTPTMHDTASFHGILMHNSRTVRSSTSCRKRLVKASVAATKLNQILLPFRHPFSIKQREPRHYT